MFISSSRYNGNNVSQISSYWEHSLYNEGRIFQVKEYLIDVGGEELIAVNRKMVEERFKWNVKE